MPSLFLNIHEYLNKVGRDRRDRHRHQGLPAVPGADPGARPGAAAVGDARLAAGEVRRQRHADDDQVLQVRRPLRHPPARDRQALRVRPVQPAGACRQGQGGRRHPDRTGKPRKSADALHCRIESAETADAPGSLRHASGLPPGTSRADGIAPSCRISGGAEIAAQRRYLHLGRHHAMAVRSACRALSSTRTLGIDAPLPDTALSAPSPPCEPRWPRQLAATRHADVNAANRLRGRREPPDNGPTHVRPHRLGRRAGLHLRRVHRCTAATSA